MAKTYSDDVTNSRDECEANNVVGTILEMG